MMPGSFQVAGAPITWGVCEVPGWGHQMGSERVLAEMAGLGMAATEAGPDGFLPRDPDDLRALLDRHRLRLAAGFIPVVLHDERSWADQRRLAAARFHTLARAGADVAVVAAATGVEGYEGSEDLDTAGWLRLAQSLGELGEFASAEGLVLTVHPHYGTVIETPRQIERFLAVSDAAVCLDTGHVMVGGGDPVGLARRIASRIRHVHLKDVDADLAARVRAGDMSYRRAVAAGLYRSLGRGDVDVAAVVEALGEEGFEGWLVLEQDKVLEKEPPADGGPRLEAEAGLRHLESVAAAAGVAGPRL